MSELVWRQRFRWSVPQNLWAVVSQRTWSWHFVDEDGSGWGRWFVEPATGGTKCVADPDLPPGYSTGIAVGKNSAVIGSATKQGFSIYRVELGEQEVATRLLFQHQERTDVGTLSSDESLVCLVHAQQGDWQHPMLHVCDQQGKMIAQLSDGPGYGLQVRGWSPLPTERRLIILRERTGWWRPALWWPERGEVVDCGVDLPGDLVDVQWYPDASALLLIHEWHGRGELYRFDLQSGRVSRIETELGTIWAAGIGADGAAWYRWNNAVRPSEIRNEHGERISSPNDNIPRGVSYSDIEVDGIHGFLVEPELPRPHPTLFLVYGHPVYHYTDSFYPMIQAWVDHGFAVVLLNCRGCNGYGKTWRDASLGNVGWTELEDAAKVHDWIIAAGIADPTRVILGGESWGGYLTLLGLGLQPERWSLGIAAYPVGDFITCYQDASEPIKATGRVQFGGTPETALAAYEKASPLTYVERVQVPVMLVVGEHDHLCPLQSNQNYIARLQALGKPYEYYLFAGGHGTTDAEEQICQVEAQINFAVTHLGIRSAM